MGAVGGLGPYIWTYLRMPNELYGDKNGIIRGSFEHTGSYSFGVNCADQTGNSVDMFLTLNIQPMVFYGLYNIDPVYVENKYPPVEYDWHRLEHIQRELSEIFDRLYQKAS